MESFRSVQAFATRAERELDRLHVAVLNASLAKLEFERDDEGGCHEVTIPVSYSATALLSFLLLPMLMPMTSSSQPGCLSIVNSGASLGVNVEDPGEARLLESFDRPKKFDAFGQYGLSKLLIMMFVAELAGTINLTEVIVNRTDLGATKGTEFFRNVDSWIMNIAVRAFMGLIGRQTADSFRIYLHSSLVLGEESHWSWTGWIIRARVIIIFGYCSLS